LPLLVSVLVAVGPVVGAYVGPLVGIVVGRRTYGCFSCLPGNGMRFKPPNLPLIMVADPLLLVWQWVAIGLSLPAVAALCRR
jgi:hypothetical protein